MAGMQVAFDPIAGLVAHVESVSQSRSARRATAGWAVARPELGEWSTPAELALACRAATGPVQDRMVAALVAVGAGDELAQLTVLAGLAGRLDSVLAAWFRAGMAPADRQAVATDLASAAWVAVAALAGEVAAGAGMPARVAWHLVDEAREWVRVPRRRERRAAARSVSVESVAGLAAADEGSSGEALARVLVDAVLDGRLSAKAVSPVYMTRVAGWPVAGVAARLGCSEAGLRVARRRAELRLAEAA